MRIEAHVHTKYSKDSLLCFWMLYLKCRLRHIDFIAITEHNNIRGGLEFKKYCEKRGNKVSVIVGEEIFTDSGEIIGIYLSKEISQGLSPEETIKQIREQGGLVYVPHPYDLKRKKTVLDEDVIARNKRDIDCIEIHNGRNISEEYDNEQKKISDKYGIVPVVGSDAHTIFEVGRNIIYVNDFINSPMGFIDALKTAKFICKPCLKSAHQITRLVKVLKLVFKGNIYELYRIIDRKFKRNKRKSSMQYLKK